MHEVQATIAREAPTGGRLAEPAVPEEPGVGGKSNIGVGVDMLRKLWVVCPRCQGMLYTRECEDNLKVCGRCQYHFRITPRERLAQLLDDGSFVEVDADLRAGDPLNFVVGNQSYAVKLKEAALKSGTQEALIYGTGSIEGRSLVVAVHNFQFIGGSMGVVVGEKVSRAFDLAAELDLPFVAIVASGGARQHEGIYALMQMAKTIVALNRFKSRHLPYISILTDPTFGGVPASYALLGDVNIAEPGALIGFAGPRVIEQMTMHALPEGVNSAEFMLLHGVIDMVVPRAGLRRTLASLLKVYSARAYRPALDQRRPCLLPPVMEAAGNDA